ncbi:MAG: GtrA family protein [Gammaproteobacteria bacterium]|jgi:putative flippase GtrA|nr:GtrA family protein [Gammaproteobacteria bacterium]
MNEILSVKMKRWLHFLIGGAINTGFTYAIYLALHTVLAYQLAYFFAYILGIVFAYWFNATLVFKVRLSWKGLFTYPIVYFVQYITSACLLGSLVEIAGITESLAPLAVSIIMLPITYMMSKFLLRHKG